MLLRHIYDAKLAQASYLIGCQTTGEAVVVDPNRDVQQYVALAEREGLRVTHVTETHIHADFVSGVRELAAATGAQLLLSAEGGSDWQYAFARDAGARLVRDGDVFFVGNLRFEVMHTPGHTPEHISFLVTDTPATDRPIGVLTGDFVFVGDVGRPDLLEKAAKVAGTMETGARTLFRSLQRFRQLADHLQIWPGHGAGSACGKALGALPQSTLGYEKITNWGLQIEDEEEFVRAVLAGQPEPPKYFADMKRINREGPRILDGLRRPGQLELAELERRLAHGELVVDTRPAADFARGHIPGTVNIPLNRSFTTWAGWLIPYDRDFSLIVEAQNAAAVDEIVRDFAFIGLDGVAGYYPDTVIDQWLSVSRSLDTIPEISASELAARMRDGSVAVLDVRGQSEWEAGHLPGVPNIPVGHLTDRLDEIPRDRPLVVQCEAGGRSAIAASVLRAHGFADVTNYTGGFRDWKQQGFPVHLARDEARAEATRRTDSSRSDSSLMGDRRTEKELAWTG
jgi:hydroxyacylglutathione hydrolase